MRVLSLWPVDLPCAGHDFQCSFVDSLQEAVSITGEAYRVITRNVFKTARSCRESFADIVDKLFAWILQHTTFEDGPDIFEEALAFWLILGIDIEMATIISTLHLCFTNGRLRCRLSSRSDPEMYNKIMDCFLVVLKYTRYSDSRMIGSGKSTSCLMGATYIGQDSFIGQVIEDEATSNWYSQSLRTFNESCRF